LLLNAKSFETKGTENSFRFRSNDVAERPKLGLALGAGAARGWSHIGILQELAAHGIHPDIIAGTSIGAVVGGCYSAGKLESLEAFARSLTKKRVLSFN
jgi:NTE family protein